MTDRPILFSAPMVRALLDGRKTQTRRVLGLRGACNIFEPGVWSESYVLDPGNADWRKRDTPFAIGDRLWVKETWQVGMSDNGPCVALRANDDRVYPEFTGRDEGAGPSFDYEAHPAKAWRHGHWIADVEARGPWSSPLHMPRWASRLTLIVTDVRIERLQDISEADAIAEGIEDVTAEVASSDPSLRFWRRYRDGGLNGYVDDPIGSYASLWTEINGPNAWEANPWVVAVTFRVERQNIDRIAA